MNKTLATLQTVAKIGKIISNILFVCSLVAAGLCVLSLMSLATGLQQFSEADLQSFYGLIEEASSLSLPSLYGVLSAGVILTLGEAALSWFAMQYFRRELLAGTPFTLAGAKEMQRLGILALVIPLAAQILAGLVLSSFQQVLPGAEPLTLDSQFSLAPGISFLILSLLCRYGAQLRNSPEN